MCGIAGLMMKTGEPADAAVLDRLIGAIGHRGPDAEGRFLHGPVGIGMTRLSIVDVAGGDQPLLSPEGMAVVCNGEIYNARWAMLGVVGCIFPELLAILGVIPQSPEEMTWFRSGVYPPAGTRPYWAGQQPPQQPSSQ